MPLKKWFLTEGAERDALDRKVASRFGDAPPFPFLLDHGEEDLLLGAIVLADQVPRHVFRGKREAFAHSSLSLRLSFELVARGFLSRCRSEKKRLLVLLPFVHSEQVDVLEAAQPLFLLHSSRASVDQAKAHLTVLKTFGRYPHRNSALGRKSTKEETNFLSQWPGWPSLPP